MRERPILFSAPMVRALLSGTKTQTRRVVKWRGLEPGLNLQFSGLSVERSGSNFVLTSPTRTSHAYRSVPQPCPYGQPGDRLRCRETWARDDEDGTLMYRADVGLGGDADEWERNRLDGAPRYRWRPSIHMPRWASRITLEVTEVRAERLQDISEADVLAEGIQRWPLGFRVEVSGAPKHESRSFDIAKDAYRWLWEQINGPGSWGDNPWVWVVAFQRTAVGSQEM